MKVTAGCKEKKIIIKIEAQIVEIPISTSILLIFILIDCSREK